MSKLHVFWPDDAASATAPNHLRIHVAESSDSNADTRPDALAPPTLSFSNWVSQLGCDQSSTMSRRARRLAGNTDCPHCRRAGTVPVMLNDGRIDRSGELIPGTATLVGFRCGHCQSEWSA